MENIEQEKLQWIKGEKAGKVETVTGSDGEWTIFESGGRVSTNLLNEFLIPVEGEPLDFDPPVPALVKAANNYKEEIPKAIPTTSSPIRTLFDKQKKNDKIKLTLSFPINVPNKAIYDVIGSSFDLDEVKEELESFIKDQLSEDTISETLLESVKELIKNRFKS